MPVQPDTAPRTGLRLRADLVRGNGAALVAGALLSVAATVTTLAVPLLVRRLVTEVARGAPVTTTAIAMGAAALLSAACAALSGYLLIRVGETLVLRLRARVVDHCLRLPLRTVAEQGAGNLVARITSDAMLLRSIVDVGVVQMPAAALTALLSIALMLYLDPVLTAVTVGAFTLAASLVVGLVRRLRVTLLAQQTALGALAQRFTSTLAALPTVKAWRGRPAVTRLLADEADALRRETLAAAGLQSLVGPVLTLGQQIALVSVVLAGGVRLVSGATTVADLTAFLLLLLQLVSPVTIVATGLSGVQAGLAARTRFQELLALPTEDDAPRADAVAADPDAPAVELRDVHVTIGGAAVLRGVSFRAPRTGITAVVGRSGAGKTTAIGLVERFAEADAGTVEVLGRDVRAWPLDDLRAHLAYVDQQVVLLEATIRENLVLSDDRTVTDAAMWRALEEVGLADDVRALPDGLGTRLGAVADLSGGQRQRLSLARVLLSDAPVVLLDEPSSQLDGLNELRLRHVVDRLATDRAVVVVAHRLSTVQHARHVVLMGEGRVVDAGRHDELYARQEEYRALVDSQRWAAADGPATPAGRPTAGPASTDRAPVLTAG